MEVYVSAKVSLMCQEKKKEARCGIQLAWTQPRRVRSLLAWAGSAQASWVACLVSVGIWACSSPATEKFTFFYVFFILYIFLYIISYRFLFSFALNLILPVFVPILYLSDKKYSPLSKPIKFIYYYFTKIFPYSGL